MFRLSGKGPVLKCDIFPPIELNNNEKWELGLIDFMTYNSIPNIEGVNNVLYFGNNEKIELPTGSVEVSDISTYVNEYLDTNNKN